MSTGKIGSPGVDMLTYPRPDSNKEALPIPDLFNRSEAASVPPPEKIGSAQI